jgi:hypothetical protein
MLFQKIQLKYKVLIFRLNSRQFFFQRQQKSLKIIIILRKRRTLAPFNKLN